MSYSVENIDIIGLKEYINEWLVERKLDSIYGLIKPSLEPRFMKPLKNGASIYQNQQYYEWLGGIYSKLSINRIGDQGIFYWFKPFERAVEILGEQRLHLLSLEKQDLNDHSEALEFIQRYVYFPYTDRNHNTGISNHSKSHASGIACFTKNFRNKRFWDDYAKSDTGVALGIRFFFKEDPVFQGYQPFILRDVYYDTGYDLDFLNELRYSTFRKFNVILTNIPETPDNNIGWMRYHYKRDKYRWENETRLSYNWWEFARINGLFIKHDKKNVIDRMEALGVETYHFDQSRLEFLTKVHFNNPFFRVQVDEVICGANVSNKQINELKELTKGEVHVWRR